MLRGCVRSFSRSRLFTLVGRAVLAVTASWGLLGLGPSDASAEFLGLDINASGSAFTPADDFTIGWSFQTDGPITLEALGYWDEGGTNLVNTLVDDHPIGLWNADGSVLLASTTVLAPTSQTPGSTLVIASTSGLGQWVFEPIAPLSLAPGSYVIGGLTTLTGDPDFDPFRLDVTLVTLDPENQLPLSNFGSGRLVISTGLAFPSGTESEFDLSFFGPNFLATPEPSTALLLGLGLLGLAGQRRTRHPQLRA